jgi:hypothetical protein
VIDKLIAFGGLHDAIQRHHPAKGAVVKDDQILSGMKRCMTILVSTLALITCCTTKKPIIRI